MQKTEFLHTLSELLKNAELPADQIESSISSFSAYLDSLPAETREKELKEFADPERLAKVLIAKREGRSARTAPTPAPVAAPATAPPEASPEGEGGETILIHDPLKKGEGKENPPLQEQVESAASENGDTVKIDVMPRPVRSSSQRTSQTASTPAVTPAQSVSSVPGSLHTTRAIKYSELDRVVAVDVKNKVLFWCLFVLMIPLILGIIVAVFGIFLAIFFAMSFVIAGCIGALIGVVGVGTGVSLFGLIYGATQLFSEVAAGLYEIGLAVTVAGASLFVGIVLYNTAIRLMPFLMKHLYALFRFVMRKGYQLFCFIRRECTGR